LGAVAYFWGHALAFFAFALAFGGKCLQNPGSQAGRIGWEEEWDEAIRREDPAEGAWESHNARAVGWG